MRIAQSLIDEMVAHAREDLPNECCGMVGGRGELVTSVYRAENEFASPLRFGVSSRDLFRITQKEMPERDEELVGIYHSHTKTAPYPSQTDVNEAEKSWPDAVYLIVSLEDPENPVVKAYWLKDLKIADVELVVE
jgi:[CysO sulfur-carrier protein]-S-L-cysteine hydrolase